MKSTVLGTILSALLCSSAFATQPGPDAEAAQTTEVEIEVAPPNSAGPEAAAPAQAVADFCFFAGTPQPEFKYTVIRKMKLGKGTYGGVKEILPRFAENAQLAGADAIINYTGSQRFGFFAWRMVRPVVRGVAIKWIDLRNPDCAAVGGTTLRTIIATDQPPPQ
jgi:hypothetical protein